MTSDVAQAAGIPRPSSVPILQAEVTLPPGWNSDVTQVWFDADDTRFFYWLIPESAERGVVGLVGDDGTRTQRLLETFLNRHNFEPETYQGAKVAMHHPRFKPWGRIGNTPVYLVGDAAGQVKTTTVGGTITGFQGAEAAVASILDGQSYRAALRSVKRELDLHWLIRRLLDRLDNRGYDLLVGAVSSRLQDFLARHNRDSMARVFWRIPFVEPRLLWVALRCLRGKSARARVLPRQIEHVVSKVTGAES
jgi:flavin-dependent dehydrogenase